MRVGLLGVAHLHVDAYAELLLQDPRVEVVGVADRDLERARRWGLPRGIDVAASAAQLLERGVDAVVVCSETSHHRADVERAAAAGVHVLCEKPLATSMVDAEAIVSACDAAGVILMTAFPMRFSADLDGVRRRMAAGDLGRVHACSGTNQSELPMRHRSWFVDPILAGGGAVMDHTVHIADALRWCLQQEVVEVYAVVNRLLHAGVVTVETGGVVALTMQDGTFATIDCSWSKPDAYPRWGGLTMEFVAERGVVAIDPHREHLTVFKDEGEPLAWPAFGENRNRLMLDEFIGAVTEGRPPAVDGIDGLRATEIALAAYESVRLGAPVRLPIGA